MIQGHERILVYVGWFIAGLMLIIDMLIWLAWFIAGTAFGIYITLDDAIRWGFWEKYEKWKNAPIEWKVNDYKRGYRKAMSFDPFY